MDKADDENGTDNTDKTNKSHGKSGRGSGNFFGIIGGSKVLEATTDEHEEKSKTSKVDDYLENIVKKTFKTLDGGNIGAGDDAFA